MTADEYLVSIWIASVDDRYGADSDEAVRVRELIAPSGEQERAIEALQQLRNRINPTYVGDLEDIDCAIAALSAINAAPEKAQAVALSEQERDSRYVVIGYGESDYPMAAFANDADELLDAVLGMIYTDPSDACDDTREEYRCDLADEDEWSEGIWRAEFEIGGIVVYDTGERVVLSVPANKEKK